MNNITKAREARNLSRKEVAVTLKVSAPTISDWESGKKIPSVANLKKLANLYNVSTDYLLGLTDGLMETPYMKALQRFCEICKKDFTTITDYYSRNPSLAEDRIYGNKMKLPEKIELNNLLGLDVEVAISLGCSVFQTLEEYADWYSEYEIAPDEQKTAIRKILALDPANQAKVKEYVNDLTASSKFEALVAQGNDAYPHRKDFNSMTKEEKLALIAKELDEQEKGKTSSESTSTFSSGESNLA